MYATTEACFISNKANLKRERERERERERGGGGDKSDEKFGRECITL